ncbi:hypothetical protein EJ08DRAFT_580594 [Tothia fuscella]|uniref:Uncharacterized protein n=1 Tax=Tothia fuscella TaxID=1048955 RepID=A0A9P4P0Y4_9PEZI|nr:hypothetical protein EJ08DRAFT_580594 [Tothia fuscella]
MAPRRSRYIVLAFLAIFLITFLSHYRDKWKHVAINDFAATGSILQQELDSLSADIPGNRTPPDSNTKYPHGKPIPNHEYTRMIVVPKKKAEDTTWLDTELPDTPKAVYVVDDWWAPLRPPKNKGNEAMVYLSYIIDFYDKLPDISVFIHAHRSAWHNNDLLDADTAMMIKHLSSARVIREGYMNLRCQWYPGCPGWLHLDAQKENEEKKEEVLVKGAWMELFPHDPMPPVLGQPCCSQFALSRDRIREVPLKEYVRLRKWILNTKLRNSMSGRIFEYLWQYLWTGSATICPSMHVCYCDGYGACFKNETKFQEWFEMRYYIRQDEWRLLGWELQEATFADLISKGRRKEAALVERGSEEQMKALKGKIDERWIVLDSWRGGALEYGKDPQVRARLAGREWREGDGY